MSSGDQRGRGAPRFNGATCLLQDSGREPTCLPTQPTESKPQSSVPDKRNKLSPPPLLSLPCSLLQSPSSSPAFLPYNSAQPSPAQKAEAEPFLQLMR